LVARTIDGLGQYFKFYSEGYRADQARAVAVSGCFFYPSKAMRAATTIGSKANATVAAKKPAR